MLLNNKNNFHARVKRLPKAAFFGLMLGMTTLSTHANTLDEIRYNAVSKDMTEIVFDFADTLSPNAELKALNNPARIEVVFDATSFDSMWQMTPVNHASVKDIVMENHQGRVKATVYLDEINFFDGQVKNDNYVLTVKESHKSSAHAELPKGQLMNQVTNIDFRRDEDKKGQVLVFLDNNQSVVDVKEKLGNIEIKFYNTGIGDDLLYTLDVTDFDTQVSAIETFREQGHTRIVVTPKSAFEFEHKQVNNVFSLIVNEKADEQSLLDDAGEYTGQPISLNFQDVSVRTVLQIIADYNGFNLVTSDSVSGDITLRLDGVPWDQALDLILKVRGLDKRMEGNILLVAPSEELAAREATELQAKQQVAELSPLYSEYIQVNYAKAAEFASLLSSDGASLLSDRGRVSVDERTNTLLIRDTAQSIEDVKRMLKVLDIPVKQVVIESRMVTVRDNIDEEVGIRWGITSNGSDSAVSGNLDGAGDANNGVVPSLDDRLNVNLPVTSASAGTIAFQVAKLADGTILDLELSALEQENKAEIIASPRITTANQKEAYIEQGTEIPFVESASSGATSVTFKKAVLGLKVTPHITPDDRIILDLKINQDTRGDEVPTGNGPAVAIDTQEIVTQVLVNNGETIVLGGIYQQQIVSAVSKVPVLGDIPYFGWLFRNSSEFNEKRELLIFVTPRIVVDDL